MALSLLTLPSSTAFLEEGFILKWEKGLPNKAADIAVFDYDRDYIANDIAVACWDNGVYVYTKNGEMQGVGIGMSSFTSVASYSSSSDKRLSYLAAGSLDDIVYGLFKLYGGRYLYTDQDSRVPTGVFWYYDAGDNVYSMGSWDRAETRKKDFIVFGVGQYYSDSSGTMYVVNSTGELNWSFNTGSVPTAFAPADLDGDSFLSHLAVGAGSSVTVLDKNGKSVWAHSFGDTVRGITPGDLDRDGQLTDILVAAGSKITAIDAKNKDIWSLETNKTVVSLSYVDEELDGIIDYYLAASGTRLLAIANNKESLSILWSYDTGRNITKHVPLDLEGDGVPDDVAIISKNSLLLYEKAFLAIPQLSLSLNMPSEVKEGADTNLTLSLFNFGEGSAKALSINGAFYMSQLNDKWVQNVSDYIGELPPAGRRDIGINLNATEAGEYSLKLDILYKDQYGGDRDMSTNFTFNIGGTEKTNGLGSSPLNPELSFELQTAQGPAEGGNTGFNLTLYNPGQSSVKNLILKGNLLLHQNVVMGVSAALEALRPGEERILPFAINDPVSGVYALELDVQYTDIYENGIRQNDTLSLVIGESEETETIEVVGNEEAVVLRPIINISRSLSSTRIGGGEDLVINITLFNLGPGEAVNVRYDAVIEDGLEFRGGERNYSGSLKPNDSVILSYMVRPVKKRLRLRTQQQNVSSGLLEYEDTEGKKYSQVLDSVEIEIKPGLIRFLIPLFVIGVLIGLLSMRQGSPKAKGNVDEKFIELFQAYKKQGKNPSYAVLKKKLGLGKNDVNLLMKKLKTEGKI